MVSAQTEISLSFMLYKRRGGRCPQMAQDPIVLSDELRSPAALIRAGIVAGLPTMIAAQGERAGRRFIEFFTANIRNRNTRLAYARAVKQFFDWCEERRLALDDIEPMTVAAYIEQLGPEVSKPTVKQHLAAPLRTQRPGAAITRRTRRRSKTTAFRRRTREVPLSLDRRNRRCSRA